MTREEIHTMSNSQLDEEIRKVLKCEWSAKFYFRDLEAVHLAEQTLTPRQWMKYIVDLCGTVPPEPEDLTEIFYKGPLRAGFLSEIWYGLSATLRQRAEALLIVLMEGDESK
jgi:hypothetical protein